MSIKKYYSALLLLLLCWGNARSQEYSTEVWVGFRVNSVVIDPNFANNAQRVRNITQFLGGIRQDSTINIVKVSFCGAASPEGSYQLNRRLARGRLAALERVVRREVDIPESLITRNPSYIPWDYLKAQVESSNLAYKDKILSILAEKPRLIKYHRGNLNIDHRVVKLQKLNGGKVWRHLHKLYFAKMRNASGVIVTYEHQPILAATLSPNILRLQPSVEHLAAPTEAKMPIDTTARWIPRLSLKTNVVGLGFGIANLEAEIDFAKHWSFSLPIYYSAWNYFKTTIKFRTFAIQPEFRYWPKKSSNDGFFVGAHFGLTSYNFSFNQKYRYQDHNRQTPAIGGGISIGYRLPISKDERWKMEFSLGAGVYPVHYDIFNNTPITTEGLMVGSEKRTYWGIDRATVAFSYAFDLKKRGGRR